MTRRNRPEDALHIAVASYLHVALPTGWVWSTVDMGGKRSKVEAALLKAKGARKGFPDIVIFGPLRDWPDTRPVIFIELKAPGRLLTDEQQRFKDEVTALGWSFWCCRSVDDVAFALHQAGVPLRAEVAA